MEVVNIFYNKLKGENAILRVQNTELQAENAILRVQNSELQAENARLQAYIETKQKEEKAEQERIKQMSNFWAYDGSVQIGGEEND